MGADPERPLREDFGGRRRGELFTLALLRNKGSVLLMSLLLCAFLSALLLGAAGSVLYAARVEKSFEESAQLFYIAEAGLARGKAFCRSVSAWPEDETDTPFSRWIAWGPGRFYVVAYDLSRNRPAPSFTRGTGILMVATAAMGERRQQRVCMLMEEPPSCQTLAWWEPE